MIIHAIQIFWNYEYFEFMVVIKIFFLNKYAEHMQDFDYYLAGRVIDGEFGKVFNVIIYIFSKGRVSNGNIKRLRKV